MMPRSDLRTAYGLTRNEARLMLCLLSGRSLTTIAAKLGITRTSARSTLVSAFCKAVDRGLAEHGMDGRNGRTGRNGQAGAASRVGEAPDRGLNRRRAQGAEAAPAEHG
jgi:hypothetical protein